jgi:hypothetical protein
MKITAAKKGQEWPKVATHNGVTVRFYRNTLTKKGEDCTTFLVRYTLLGAPKMKGFAEE